ncbi:MAG TPA: hypothetical protein VFO19_06765 [Vicinamibacterales bacterium]|nr:hypothetical protein [Vicinamibacterales bacterium]
MEQRPLRLGDIVDDYCPRERRITNHAIVAIVGEVVRQTRCTTCDAEHVYKEAKVPRRRKGDAGDDRAGDGTPGQLVTPAAEAAAVPAPVPEPEPAARVAAPPALTKHVAEPAPAEPPDGPEPVADAHVDGWHSHRRLIRATLPRTEGEQPPPRPIPEFTMHQRQSRGGQRHGGHWHVRGANGEVNGNVAPRNGFRHGRQGQGQPGQGGGHGQPSGHGGHGEQGHGAGHGHGRPGRKNRHRRGHKRPR